MRRRRMIAGANAPRGLVPVGGARPSSSYSASGSRRWIRRRQIEPIADWSSRCSSYSPAICLISSILAGLDIEGRIEHVELDRTASGDGTFTTVRVPEFSSSRIAIGAVATWRRICSCSSGFQVRHPTPRTSSNSSLWSVEARWIANSSL